MTRAAALATSWIRVAAGTGAAAMEPMARCIRAAQLAPPLAHAASADAMAVSICADRGAVWAKLALARIVTRAVARVSCLIMKPPRYA